MDQCMDKRVAHKKRDSLQDYIDVQGEHETTMTSVAWSCACLIFLQAQLQLILNDHELK